MLLLVNRSIFAGKRSLVYRTPLAGRLWFRPVIVNISTVYGFTNHDILENVIEG